MCDNVTTYRAFTLTSPNQRYVIAAKGRVSSEQCAAVHCALVADAAPCSTYTLGALWPERHNVTRAPMHAG
jgi:hypothetical protein